MSEHAELLQAMQEQAAAFQDLAKAIADLADSNREIIDYLSSQHEADDPEAQSGTYLDGSRVSLG